MKLEKADFAPVLAALEAAASAELAGQDPQPFLRQALGLALALIIGALF